MPTFGASRAGYKRRFTAAVKLRQNKRAARAAASRALNQKIKSVIQKNKESKDLESALSPDNNVSTSGIQNGLINMAQGAGVWNRQGDDIQPTSLTVKYQLGMQSSSDAYNNVRVMLVQLKVPAAEVTTSEMPAVTDRITDEQRRLFRVLYDRTFTLNAKPLGDNAGGYMEYKQPFRYISIYGKRLHKAIWSDTASAVEPNIKGAIRLYAVSDSSLASHPLLTFRYQIYAKDDN